MKSASFSTRADRRSPPCFFAATLPIVSCCAAQQLAIEGSVEAMAAYAASEGRWRHGPRIRERYGYRPFTDAGVGFRLNRFLYALCWTGTDRPSTLFERAVAWLMATYTNLRCSGFMCPLTAPDRDDFPGLVDEPVPGVAA